jgi:glycosyltransferase involved in cell wall biosynthesis
MTKLATSSHASLTTGHAQAVEEPVALSVVVPCFNEKDAVEATLRQLERVLAAIGPYEIIAVDDGSTDGTGDILDGLMPEIASLHVVRHPINRGYGGALKSGIRVARGRFLAITDSDGTYPNERIPELLARAQAGADMVVGARVGDGVVYSKLRAFPKAFMRRYCMWVTRQLIPDMNSGLRVFNREVLERFVSYLPNSFSFTTTVTIAFMTNQYQVEYVPISYAPRTGKSKIQPIRDTIRFMQLIVRTALYFAPLRVFGPLVLLLWAAFLLAFGYDVLYRENLSDKSVLLLTFAANVTILALLADMIDKRLGD